ADRAAALVAKLNTAVPQCSVAAATSVSNRIDMIVNASPVGMHADDAMPGEIARLSAGTLVGDVVIAQAPTALVRHAIACGCRWIDGRDMHAGQVDAITNFFAHGARTR